jgi:hypothetical protein
VTSAVAFEDITPRKRGESGSAKSDEGQALLLELSGCVAALSDPVAVQETACRVLGRKGLSQIASIAKPETILSWCDTTTCVTTSS